MAVKQIGVTTGGNKKDYQAYTTDAVETYPSGNACGAGSTMLVIDPVLKEVLYALYFDGTNWNTM